MSIPHWQLAKTHLSVVEDTHGTGAASAAIRNIVEEGIKKANDLSQAERIAEKGTTDKENPYVTDAGKCPRAVWFSLRNEEPTEPLTLDSLVNFGTGHAIEEWLANVLEAQGAEVLREQRIEIPTGDTVVSGRVDFIVGLPEQNILIELKTTSSIAMKMMLANKEPGREEHRKQLNLYLEASQRGLLPHRYDTGFLVYVVKNATKREPVLHSFEVRYNEVMAKADLKNLATIHEYARDDLEINIPIEFASHKQSKGKLHWRCQYCSYKSKCWGDAK